MLVTIVTLSISDGICLLSEIINECNIDVEDNQDINIIIINQERAFNITNEEAQRAIKIVLQKNTDFP